MCLFVVGAGFGGTPPSVDCLPPFVPGFVHVLLCALVQGISGKNFAQYMCTFTPCCLPRCQILKVECIDVDDASSSAPPATLLRESDHSPPVYINR